MQAETFNGKTTIDVRQDIFAKTIKVSMRASVSFPIEEKVVKEYQEAKKIGEVKQAWKINHTNACCLTKGMLIGMFIEKKIKAVLAIFDKLVESNTEGDRPGIKVPERKAPLVFIV